MSYEQDKARLIRDFETELAEIRKSWNIKVKPKDAPKQTPTKPATPAARNN